MTRKFKLAVKIFIDEDGLKIIRNSKNENVILLYHWHHLIIHRAEANPGSHLYCRDILLPVQHFQSVYRG